MFILLKVELRDLAYKDTPVEVNPNPEQVLEEVQRVLWLRDPPPNLTQKKWCGDIRGEYSGQIRSWDFDSQNNLVMIKRTGGVKYFTPRFKNLGTLPAHDLHHIAQLYLNTPTSNGIIKALKKTLEEESRSSQWN
ncbi:hypothetical protein Hanom_Chr14g01249941 [Helianthus anomalus]